jgi:TPR repeat protein
VQLQDFEKLQHEEIHSQCEILVSIDGHISAYFVKFISHYCHITGLIYQFGRQGVVEPDLGAALLWYERAALGGNLQARSLLLQTLPARLADCWSRAISGTDASAHRECSVLYSEGWSLASMSESSSTLMRKHIRPHIHLTYEWVQRAFIQASRDVKWQRFIPIDSSTDLLSLQCKPFSMSQPLGDQQQDADNQSENHEHSLMNLLFRYSAQLEVASVLPISKQSSLDPLPTRNIPLLTASTSAMLSPTESKIGDFRMVPPSLLSTSGHFTVGPDGQFESGAVSTTSNLLETTLQLPRVEPIDSRPASRGFNSNNDVPAESTAPSIPLVVTESELPPAAIPEPRQISTAAARMSESASHRRLMLSSPMSISRPGTAQTLRAQTAAKDAVAALSAMKKSPPTVEDLDLELELSQHGRLGSHTAFLLSALLLAGTSTSIAISSQLTTPSANLNSPVGSNLFHLESVWARCAIHLIAHLRRAAHVPAAPPSVLNDPFANGLKPHFHSQIEFSDYSPFSPAHVLLGSRLIASTAATLPPETQLWVQSVVRLAELYSTPAPVADDELDIGHVGRKDSIPSDPLRAFCLRHIAAASGQASEMRLIGQTHLEGLSISLPEAARLLHKRPSTSSPALSVLKPNVVLAAEWFAEATAAGDAQARTALRQLMSTPIADLMEQAIAGDVDSQFALGLIYDTGLAALVQFPQTLAEVQIANADSKFQYLRSVISDGAPSIVHVRIAPGLPLPSRPVTRSSPSPLPGKASPSDFSPLKTISPPRRNLHSRSRSVASPPSAAKLVSNQKPIHFIDDSAVGVRSSLWAINSKALDGHTAQSSDTVLFGLETRPPGVVVCAAAAWHWYSRAAARGHAGAKNNLALMALTSLSQASDTSERALKLMNEAAQAGCAPAMFNLGLHFLNRPEPITPVEIAKPEVAAAATVVMPAVADVGPSAPELKLDNIQKPKVSEARKTDLALSCDWFQAVC